MTETEIRDRLRQAIKGSPQTILGEVRSVDKQNRTCDIDNDGVTIYGVRLQPVTGGGTGIVIYPKTGAQALCIQVEESGDYMLLYAAENESVELKIGERSLTADQNGFVFNGGTVGSVKADKMTEWMMKVYTDLQTLQALLLSSPVAGNGANLAIVFTPQTPSPQLADFADDKLKH